MTFETDAETFEAERPTLMGVAYRVLGSTADAADAVQDTYLAWMRADKDEIRNARAWLITVCSRRALHMATAASRRRSTTSAPGCPTSCTRRRATTRASRPRWRRR
jgi:RNA polymerase sigma-70 factor (ECF subfamily)